MYVGGDKCSVDSNINQDQAVWKDLGTSTVSHCCFILTTNPILSLHRFTVKLLMDFTKALDPLYLLLQLSCLAVRIMSIQ